MIHLRAYLKRYLKKIIGEIRQNNDRDEKSSFIIIENVLIDGGYSGEPFANGVKKLLQCEVEVAKRNELHIFKVIPKRWVVERSFSW